MWAVDMLGIRTESLPYLDLNSRCKRVAFLGSGRNAAG